MYDVHLGLIGPKSWRTEMTSDRIGCTDQSHKSDLRLKWPHTGTFIKLCVAITDWAQQSTVVERCGTS